jgi:sulfur relay protein TusB/DsrH
MKHLLARGATVCVLHEDLALRGLVSAELLEPVTRVDYRKIVDLLADNHTQAIGCV